MSDERLTRRALIAGAGAGGLGAALAAPVLAQKLIDLGLPGGCQRAPALGELSPGPRRHCLWDATMAGNESRPSSATPVVRAGG